MILVGVDGCPGGWVAAITKPRGRRIRLATAPSLADLLGPIDGAAVVAVDIPIGLPDTGRRRCDEQARKLLGVRRSTIFYAPPKCVLEADSHSEACDLAEASTGKRISLQAWNLVPKIRETAALHAKLPADCQLMETHPELCFARMAGGSALEESKKAPGGQRRRVELLKGRLGRERVSDALAEIESTRGRPPLADRLDALACLSTALYRNQLEEAVLPQDAARGEPQIVY